MVQAVSHRPLTAETRLRYQVIPFKICGQSGIGDRFFSESVGFPLQSIFTNAPNPCTPACFSYH